MHWRAQPPAPLAAERRPSRNAQYLNIRNASVNGSVQLQTRDFVLHQQLATFQSHDLKIIDRWVGPRFADFRLEGPMTSFQFRKMGFYGHVVEFSSVSFVPDGTYTTPKRPYFEARFLMMQRNNPRFA
jgi:hypothetical protein